MRTITWKSAAEIAKMHAVNQVVAEVLDAVEAECRAGVTTWHLNEVALREMRKRGATSAFLGYAPPGKPPYPAVICTSINEKIVHGVPRKDEILAEGDIVGIDFGCVKDGFVGDSARTVMIGKVSDEARALVETTREALDHAIQHAVVGNRLGDIGWAVESLVEQRGYSVVRAFVGHGIGRRMHEDPVVPNHGTPGRGLRLKAGLVIAIEPMVNVGTFEVEELDDGWTAVTADGTLSAHFEHSVAITDRGPIVLSGRKS